ncbi:hypothetical protein SLS64_010316 [Diaporthe eres]
MAETPSAMKLGLSHLRIQREGRPLFFDALDFKERFGQDTKSSTVLFVDVGGSTGSQSLTLRKRYPDLPGRVLIQCRPEMVEHAKEQLVNSDKIEVEVHDIFTPQPVKVNAKAGLTDQSVILIDEVVLPERHATAQGSEDDLELMACVSGIQRTKAQWETLLDDAGLKMLEVVNYNEDYEDSVIIAGLH